MKGSRGLAFRIAGWRFSRLAKRLALRSARSTVLVRLSATQV